MGRQNARKLALAGGQTIKELRDLVDSYMGGSKPARVNKGLTADHAKKIFTDALATFPDDYVFKEAWYDDRGRNMSAKDTLMVQNVLRECG